jgi:hypothetical protein
MSPLAYIKETFHSIFRKAGKVTLQTSLSQTYWSQCQTVSWQAVSSPTFAPSPIKKRSCSKDCVRLESFARQTIPNGPHKALLYLKRTNRSDLSLIFACWTDSYADTHFRYLRFKKLCVQSMDLPSFPSSTSTWDFGRSNLTKKVNDLQQSSSPGASILTNALRWDYLSAPISIKRKCPPSFRTWKT